MVAKFECENIHFPDTYTQMGHAQTMEQKMQEPGAAYGTVITTHGIKQSGFLGKSNQTRSANCWRFCTQ